MLTFSISIMYSTIFSTNSSGRWEASFCTSVDIVSGVLVVARILAVFLGLSVVCVEGEQVAKHCLVLVDAFENNVNQILTDKD